MDALTQKQAVVGAVRVYYLEREARGAGSAAPILLLHSLLATAETLTELIAGLPLDRRVVAIDLLSARRVDSTEKLDAHSAELAELVHGFIVSAGLAQPVVIGHSHGGTLALRLAATHRSLLKCLVLLCPAHPFGGYRSHVVNFYLKRHGRILALSIPLAPSWMILRAYNQAAGSKRRILMGQLRPHLRVLRNRDTLRRVLEILKVWDEDMAGLQRDLTDAPIATPTLLIWGEEDVIVPPASAAELEKHLEDRVLATLPGMGHLLAEEAPAECAGLIEAWLQELDARG